MKRLLPLLFLVPLAASAEDGAEKPATITVKPLLCIVDARTPECEMRFSVAWTGAVSGYYCVFSELQPDALRCWAEASRGDLEDDRTVDETFTYWLNQGQDKPVLATATVDVLRKDSDDRRRRRRTRHVWDIL